LDRRPLSNTLTTYEDFIMHGKRLLAGLPRTVCDSLPLTEHVAAPAHSISFHSRDSVNAGISCGPVSVCLSHSGGIV